MPYRLLALDLDDTLLREDLTISDRTRLTLIRAQEEGTTLVLASGRPTGSIWPYARQLDLPRFGGFIVGFNGAEVTDCATGQVVFQKSLTRDEVHEVYRLSRAHGLSVLSYQGEAIVTPEASPWADIERKLTGLDLVVTPDFEAQMDGPAVKAILVQEPEVLREAKEVLTPVLGDRLNLAISKPFFLEVTARGVDKGRTLGQLADRLGLTADQAMAVGDSYNDLGMLEWAGLGVCMANGPAEVRSRADVVTTSNLEDGVAAAVQRYLLKGDPVLS